LNGEALRTIEQPPASADERMLGKNLFGRPRGDAGENRPAAGQPHVRRLRHVEDVIEIEEETEDIGPADDADPPVRRSERGQGFVERRTPYGQKKKRPRIKSSFRL